MSCYQLTLALGAGRVFADTWNLENLAPTSHCAGCFEARRARLEAMNRAQEAIPPFPCAACGVSSPS